MTNKVYKIGDRIRIAVNNNGGCVPVSKWTKNDPEVCGIILKEYFDGCWIVYIQYNSDGSNPTGFTYTMDQQYINNHDLAPKYIGYLERDVYDSSIIGLARKNSCKECYDRRNK